MIFLKSTKTIYITILLACSFGLFFILQSYKQSEIKQLLEENKKEILHKYSEVFKSYFELGELIYFNEFIKDKTLLNILKNENNTLEKEIYQKSVDSFALYSNLGLSNLSFYDINKKLILSFLDKNNIKIDESKLSKTDDFCFVRNENNIYLIFIKPIFDEKLNFFGVLTTEFLFDDFIQKLQKELNFKSSFFIADNFEEEIKEDFTTINIHNFMDNKKLILKVEYKLEKIDSINNIFFAAYILLIIFLSYTIFITYKFLYYKNELLVTKRLNKEFFENMDEHILRLDTNINGDIVYASNAFCRASGYSKDEIIGKNASILRHPDMSNNFYKNLWNELKVTKFWQGEVKNRDKFGNTYWIKSIIFPKYDQKNELIGFSSIRFDISSIKQLEKINRLLKEDLAKQLNRIKQKTNNDDFKLDIMSKTADSMSHLWKEPISKISTEIQKLEDINIQNNINKELLKLSNMLNEFKSIFKHTSDKTNLLEVLNSIKESFLDEIKEHNINIKFQNNLDTNIKISRIELKNILSNILKTQIECLKFSSFFEVSINISALNEENSNEIVIKIEDNIKKDKINEHFEDLLNSRSDKFFDSSIHLAKLLIEKNGGIFWHKNSMYDTRYYIKLQKDLI